MLQYCRNLLREIFPTLDMTNIILIYFWRKDLHTKLTQIQTSTEISLTQRHFIEKVFPKKETNCPTSTSLTSPWNHRFFGKHRPTTLCGISQHVEVTHFGSTTWPAAARWFCGWSWFPKYPETATAESLTFPNEVSSVVGNTNQEQLARRLNMSSIIS